MWKGKSAQFQTCENQPKDARPRDEGRNHGWERVLLLARVPAQRVARPVGPVARGAARVKWCGLPLVRDLEWGAGFLFSSAVEVDLFQKRLYGSTKCTEKSAPILRAQPFNFYKLNSCT